VTLTQISYIPAKEPVLLNNATTTTTDNTEYPFNLLQYAGEDIDVDDMYYYGLHNGAFMRVTGTIPEGKIYLYAEEPNAPQLQIVINEGNTTGISGATLVNSEEVKGDLYDLQGRKVVYPKKKGLYIQKGRKVVVNNK
jgi:ribosome-interacting GTPase 1